MNRAIKSLEPIKLELDMSDIAAFVKPGHSWTWCSPDPTKIPNVEITFCDDYGERPTSAHEAGEALAEEWERA